MYIFKQILQQTRLLSITFLWMVTTIVVAQNTVVQGKVLDKETNEPLIAAVVKFTNSGIGAVTDINGNFKISNSTGLTEVEIGLLGYESVTFRVPAQKTTNRQIQLAPVGINLDEVVIKSQAHKYSKRTIQLLN